MTTEIPREEWPAFCDNFTRQHHGWLVTLEASHEGGPAVLSGEHFELSHDQPLQAVVAELHDESVDHIQVIVGPEDGEHLTHQITAPTSIRVEQTIEGADETLTIESLQSGTTTLRFRVAALPEMVDGI